MSQIAVFLLRLLFWVLHNHKHRKYQYHGFGSILGLGSWFFLPHKNCHTSTHPQPLHIPFPCPYLVPGSIGGFAKPNNYQAPRCAGWTSLGLLLAWSKKVCDFSKGPSAPGGRKCVFSVITDNHYKQINWRTLSISKSSQIIGSHRFFSANNLRWFTLFYYRTAGNALLHSTPGADQGLKDAEKKLLTTHVLQRSEVWL